MDSPETRGRIRKPHRKTRSGCSTCKRRRVKCDERRPACGNCTGRSLMCGYAAVRPFDQMADQMASAMMRRVPMNNSSVPASLSDASLLNLEDLELLHHFITTTFSTVTGGDEQAARVLETEVPRLALENEYLLRVILATSAIHMASYQQHRAQPLVSRAIGHHSIGLRGGAAIIPRLSQENCSALYCFATFTTVLSLSLNRFVSLDEGLSQGDDPSAGPWLGDGLFEWLNHMRGVSSILISSRHWLARTSIWPMVDYDYQSVRMPRADIQLSYPGEEHFRALHRFVVHHVGSAEPDTLNVLLDAMDELSKSCILAHNLGVGRHAVRAVFSFPGLVSTDYLCLLRDHHPLALLIFAHFGVLLQRLHVIWWLGGLGKALIERINDFLGPAYQELMRWPMEEVAEEG